MLVNQQVISTMKSAQAARSLLSQNMTMKNHNNRRSGWWRNEAGYSLQEMMTVVMIIGIVTATGVGYFQTAVPQSKLRDATTELQSTYNVARLMAMSQNATITVKLSGASETTAGSNVVLAASYASPLKMTLTRTISGSESVISTTPLNGEVTELIMTPGMSTPTPKAWIQFNSRGLRVGGTTTLITLKNTQGRIYSVSVGPTGKSKWCLSNTCS